MDLDLGRIAQISSRRHTGREHVEAHRTQKEMQQMSLLESFIDEMVEININSLEIEI